MVQLEGLVDYTDIQLEQMAHEYLRKRQDVQFKIPVNVEALLDGCENVDVDDVADISRYARIEGCVCRHMNGRDLKVYIDRRIVDFSPKPAYFAVVAEELAHIVLHQGIFIQIKSFYEFLDFQKSPHWHRIERDARRFSAAIRMPYKNLVMAAEKTYPEIIDEHGYGDTWSIQKLLRNALAEMFAVPQTDMHSRLMQWPCHIFDRATASIQCRSGRLVEPDAVPKIVCRTSQGQLF